MAHRKNKFKSTMQPTLRAPNPEKYRPAQAPNTPGPYNTPGTKIFSRPSGTGAERNPEITNLSPAEREKIQQANANEGRILAQAFAENTKATIENNLATQQQQEAMQTQKDLVSDVGVYEDLPDDKAGTLGTNIKQIIPEVISNVGSRAAIGATSAGTIGAGIGAFGAGIGAAPGAALGAVAGGIGGAVSALFSSIGTLKSEMRQTATEQKATFTSSKTAIKDIINSVNHGYPYKPGEAEELFESELARIDRAERNLKQLSENNWLSKAKDDLTRIETWNRAGKLRAIRDMQLALLKPNPNAPIQDYAEPELEITS